MKPSLLISLFTMALLMTIPSSHANETIKLDSSKWKLIWSDEFNGTEINKKNWTHVDKGDGFGNNELQWYSPRKKNSYIKDGKLVIEAHKEQYKGRPYTSAKLESKGKADFTYGKFSFRAKLPYGQGIWPAIWMMPTDFQDKNAKYGGWPMCGEIDIMELVGHKPDTVHGTLHYGNPWPGNVHSGKSYKLKSGRFHDKFHTFDLIWRPGMISWYVDGEHYSSQTSWFTAAKGATYPAPYDRDFFLILNLAVGGNWPKYPDHTTVFPQRLVIDYARVYKYEGEWPEIISPLQADVDAIAPGFELKHNDNNNGKGLKTNHNGRKALQTHPLNKTTPAALVKEFKVPSGKKTVVKFGASNHQRFNWELRVKVDDKVISKTLVSPKSAPKGWLDQEIDLSAYAGKTIKLQLENAANNWYNEHGYWSGVEVVSQ